MECDLCGKKEATIHLTEVVNEEVTKLHICDDCAQEKSEEMQSHFGLTDLLAGLVEFGPTLSEGGLPIDVKTSCPGCESTYYDFQKTGRLGCGKCYDAFSKNLSELLRRIHGSDRHVGKMPFKGKAVVKDQVDLKCLKDELSSLVQAEEFEKATILRDRVKEIEDKIENGE